MSQRQPRAELAGRRVGRGAVEGHHRRRDSGRPDDLGAPPVDGDGRDLDVVETSADGFVEPLNGWHAERWSG